MAIRYSIDVINRQNERLFITGWALNDSAPEKDICFKAKKGHRNLQIIRKEIDRPDVVRTLLHDQTVKRKPGFQISFPFHIGDEVQVFLCCGFHKIKLSFEYQKVRDLICQRQKETIDREEELYRKNPETAEISYGLYRRLNDLKEEDIFQQRMKVWNRKPLISVAVALYETPHDTFEVFLKSVLNQTYSNWELCLADGSRNDDLKDIVQAVMKDDSRVHYQYLNGNHGISANQNAAIRMTNGEYVAFCDHDDVLSLDALFRVAETIEKNQNADYLYSDSDQVNDDGTIYYNDYFKPEMDVDLLRSVNYINHLSVIKKTFLDKIGYLDPQFDGAQDHDLVLRALEHHGNFVHIPEVLYHWRAIEGSTAINSDEKQYTSEAGTRVISRNWKRMYPEVKIEKVEVNESNGTYHTVFSFEKEPLVSVIFDGRKNLDNCRKSVLSGKWKNLELIETEAESNHAAALNHAAVRANGQYLLFVKTTDEMKSENTIKEMVGYGQRRDTGVVGALISDLQHKIVSSGILLGINGSYANVLEGADPEDNIYFSRDGEVQNYMAVSDHAFLIRKELLENMHGFDETFEWEGTVIDLCLRCSEEGLWNVYDPYASFIAKERIAFHYEDQVHIARKYQDLIQKGDPFSNVNLSVRKADFTRRIIRKDLN